MSAPYGWTVVRSRTQHRTKKAYHVYKRDCPADVAHWSDDLAPFTHATKSAAVAAGERGEYAYKNKDEV